MKIFGVEPDAPVTTNENGGMQSDTPYAFHMLPTSALFAAADVCAYGAKKYGETFNDRNYTKISTVEHINHAIQHLYAYLAGDTSDDHLGHAIVRTMFAYDTAQQEKEDAPHIDPEKIDRCILCGSKDVEVYDDHMYCPDCTCYLKFQKDC